MENILREPYIEQIERYLGKQTIIVLVGQRRVGKSCLLKTLRDKKEMEDKSNVIYIDKEKREFDDIKNYTDLNDYIESHLKKRRHNYIVAPYKLYNPLIFKEKTLVKACIYPQKAVPYAV